MRTALFAGSGRQTHCPAQSQKCLQRATNSDTHFLPRSENMHALYSTVKWGRKDDFLKHSGTWSVNVQSQRTDPVLGLNFCVFCVWVHKLLPDMISQQLGGSLCLTRMSKFNTGAGRQRGQTCRYSTFPASRYCHSTATSKTRINKVKMQQ